MSTDPNYDVADPATGLTPREKDVIRTTWAKAKEDIPGTGYDLFIRQDVIHQRCCVTA